MSVLICSSLALVLLCQFLLVDCVVMTSSMQPHSHAANGNVSIICRNSASGIGQSVLEAPVIGQSVAGAMSAIGQYVYEVASDIGQSVSEVASDIGQSVPEAYFLTDNWHDLTFDHGVCYDGWDINDNVEFHDWLRCGQGTEEFLDWIQSGVQPLAKKTNTTLHKVHYWHFV